jgi:hypothetical protein
MKALTIDIQNKNIKEIDIEMTANTVYSFFSSILIDDLATLKDHTIYTDANALSDSKQAYFIGEQLLIGDALITGRSPHGDLDITIPTKDLEELISYEVNQFYTETISLLSQTDINLYRSFELSKNGERMNLNAEWVLYTFNIADERTREYFLNELGKNISSTENAEAFIQKMAGLALNAA